MINTYVKLQYFSQSSSLEPSSLTPNIFLQMKTGMVALVLCLNISCDPPDVIKISPCARLECWIGMSNFFSCSFNCDRLAVQVNEFPLWIMTKLYSWRRVVSFTFIFLSLQNCTQCFFAGK